MQYVRRDCTILQYSVLRILPGKYRFSLLSMPENFVFLFAIISTWGFQDIFSFTVNPRKLKLLTHSMGVSSILTVVNKSSIFLFMAWKTMFLVSLIFKDNLFTANQS